MASIDPTTIATQLATAYTQPAQSMLKVQQETLQAKSTALDKLQSALQTFTSALSGLSAKKSVTQYSASFNTSDIGSVSASATAQAGTYSLFVEQLATSHQVVFGNLPSVPVAASGSMVVQQANGASFTVNFNGADQNGDSMLSQTEIARAINQAVGNQGKVNAMLVTAGGQTQLVLAAGSTGADAAITLDTSGLAAGDLKTSLDNGTELVQARDAIVWLGAQGTGVMMQQASNTYTNIQGVSMTFAKAMQGGDPPLTLTVASDNDGTAANVQGFVDAYNALNKALDELTANGGEDKKKSALASDSGVRALRTQLAGLIRQSVAGLRLLDFGVTSTRSGTFSLDKSQLQKKMAAQPDGLNQLFGSAALGNSSGILGSMNDYVKTWTGFTTGQIKLRKDTMEKTRGEIAQRQARLDTQYSNAYQRYLSQFSRLQALEAQMEQNTGMLGRLNVS